MFEVQTYLHFNNSPQDVDDIIGLLKTTQSGVLVSKHIYDRGTPAFDTQLTIRSSFNDKTSAIGYMLKLAAMKTSLVQMFGTYASRFRIVRELQPSYLAYDEVASVMDGVYFETEVEVAISDLQVLRKVNTDHLLLSKDIDKLPLGTHHPYTLTHRSVNDNCTSSDHAHAFNLNTFKELKEVEKKDDRFKVLYYTTKTVVLDSALHLDDEWANTPIFSSN